MCSRSSILISLKHQSDNFKNKITKHPVDAQMRFPFFMSETVYRIPQSSKQYANGLSENRICMFWRNISCIPLQHFLLLLKYWNVGYVKMILLWILNRVKVQFFSQE